MTIRTLVALAGMAACGGAGGQTGLVPTGAPLSGEVHRAVRATAIAGLTADGRYVYGKTVELGDGAAERGAGVVAYDSAQVSGAAGFACGNVFPHTFSSPGERYFINIPMQTNAEDIVPHPGTEGGVVEDLSFLGVGVLCQGIETERLAIVFESWEGFGGFNGFDTDGDGFGFPFSRTDGDGDTFIDEFLGGIVLDFGDLPAFPGGGYNVYAATGLSTLGVPLTSNLDLWDNGNPGSDGRSDGGVRILWTRGNGGDGMGPLNGGLYPSRYAYPMLWGTLAMEVPGTLCPSAGQPGFGVGDSDGVFWTESRNYCDPSGFGEVDDVYDLSFDVADWTSIVPDFQALGPAFRISVIPESVEYNCCDANADGACTPADFGAWIAAFNSMAPRCDANNDGNCTPADFGAWIAAFNASNGGNPLLCQE